MPPFSYRIIVILSIIPKISLLLSFIITSQLVMNQQRSTWKCTLFSIYTFLSWFIWMGIPYSHSQREELPRRPASQLSPFFSFFYLSHFLPTHKEPFVTCQKGRKVPYHIMLDCNYSILLFQRVHSFCLFHSFTGSVPTPPSMITQWRDEKRSLKFLLMLFVKERHLE